MIIIVPFIHALHVTLWLTLALCAVRMYRIFMTKRRTYEKEIPYLKILFVITGLRLLAQKIRYMRTAQSAKIRQG